jgi:hypothetical protein
MISFQLVVVHDIPSQVTIEHMVSEEGYEEKWNEGDEWNEIWIHTHISFL